MRSAWLQVPPAMNGRMPVYCFPFAGGSAIFFRPWTRNAPPSVAIVPVQPPGRDERLREAFLARMTAIVDEATRALLPLVSREPYAMFGHSMGATIAYEVAQELRRRGALLPKHLFVSGAPAPHRAAEIPAIYDLPDDELLEQMQERYQALPAEILASRELVELLLPRLRADFTVTGTYVWNEAPPLDCPITAFGGTDDRTVTPDMVESWREHTRAGFQSEFFPGGHFFINDHHSRILSALGEAVG